LLLNLTYLKKNLKTFVTVGLFIFNAQKIFDFEFIYEFGSVLGSKSQVQFK